MKLFLYNIYNIYKMNHKSLLYIGAGTDTNPLSHFPDVKTFIFIDTQPRSEFDSINSYIHWYSRQDFVKQVNLEYTKIGFSLVSEKVLDAEYYKQILNKDQLAIYESETIAFSFINPTLLVFINTQTGQTVKYYISTNILSNMNIELIDDIKNIYGLIICGFNPHKVLLDYITPPINFYGYSETVYRYITISDDEEHINSVLAELQNNTEQKYFSNFYFINQNSGEIIRKEKYSNFFSCN
uniref:Uncharacterized protein n=1 Tax=viral metagenome TaxID=1070528 RepID=A0A6C0CZJ9_9ZZZZ